MQREENKVFACIHFCTISAGHDARLYQGSAHDNLTLLGLRQLIELNRTEEEERSESAQHEK